MSVAWLKHRDTYDGDTYHVTPSQRRRAREETCYEHAHPFSAPTPTSPLSEAADELPLACDPAVAHLPLVAPTAGVFYLATANSTPTRASGFEETR